MDYVNLGQTGLKVSRLCLGCMTYGAKTWRDWVLEEAEAKPFIRQALDAGINFFDTADMYSQGESEALLGRVLGAERSSIFIATKAGYSLPGRRKLAGHLKPILRPVIRALGIRRDPGEQADGVLVERFAGRP